MSAAPAKMITLKSSDEQTFVIEEAVALQSKTLEHMIVDIETENIVIPLTTITGSILAKVIEYLNKHAEAETSDEDKKIWDAQFLNFDFGTNSQLVIDMIQAADFLNIKGLMDLGSKKMLMWIDGKSPKEIHRVFIPEDDEEEEEEQEVRAVDGWTFED